MGWVDITYQCGEGKKTWQRVWKYESEGDESCCSCIDTCCEAMPWAKCCHGLKDMKEDAIDAAQSLAGVNETAECHGIRLASRPA